jgi:hypothetical protein
MTTTTPVQTTTCQHPARAYLRELPEALRDVRAELADVRHAVRDMWPFMWTTTHYRDVERLSQESFDMGRWVEQLEAEKRSAAGGDLS